MRAFVTPPEGLWSHIVVAYSLNKEMLSLFSEEKQTMNLAGSDMTTWLISLPISGAIYKFEAYTISQSDIQSLRSVEENVITGKQRFCDNLQLQEMNFTLPGRGSPSTQKI